MSNAEATTFIPCNNPNCNKTLRVPLNRGRLKITCPHCKENFLWDSLSTRELDFRCAKTGKQFRVIFTRVNHNHNFRIARILNSIEQTLITNQSSFSSSPELHYHTEAEQKFDAKDFDFSGWHCPHCGHKERPLFIKCGTCQECVCGTRVIKVTDTVSTFECHDGCRGSGEIKGEITDYTGKPTIVNKSKSDVSSSKNRISREGYEMPRLDGKK